jgi:hypothetical protein
MIHGLKVGSEMNGKDATCKKWDATAGRMEVELADGSLKSIKPIHMRKIVEKSDSDDELDEDPQYNKVLKVFQQFDRDGDGIIDRQEFEKCLASLGLPKSCIGSFLVSVDKNGDLEIQYGEFVKWALAPAGKKTQKSRADVYWPDAKAEEDAAVEKLDHDSDLESEPDPDEELSLDDVKRIIGEDLPEGWPSHGLTVLNNMRRRFPGYPVEGIVWRMRRNNFIGGKVIAAIRATGAREVEVIPPSAVKDWIGSRVH